MKKTALAAVALLAAMLTGCDKQEASVPTEIIINTVSGEEAAEAAFPVELPDGTEINSAAERAASLSPAATEIIAELGFADRLCAVSRYCDYPEGLTEVTAGSSENPDTDRLMELSPQVVFTVSQLAERELYTLGSAGITVVTLNAPHTLEDYSTLYSTIASVFKGKDAGKAAGEAAAGYLKALSSGIKLGTFIYVTPKLTAAGADTFESSVLSLCGDNLCTAAGYVSEPEELAEAPDYIIASDSLTEAELSADARYSGMLSNGAKVLFVPSERFERPSARLAEIFSSISGQLEE